MSGIKGANIGDMDRLATQLAALGDKLDTTTQQLGGRLDTASSQLTDTMGRLYGNGERLIEENQAISTDLDRVVAAAHWTGPRGDRFREAEQTVVQAVDSTNTANLEVMGQAKSVIDGQVTTSLEESRTSAVRSGQQGREVSHSFGKKVDGIRQGYSSTLGIG